MFARFVFGIGFGGELLWLYTPGTASPPTKPDSWAEPAPWPDGNVAANACPGDPCSDDLCPGLPGLRSSSCGGYNHTLSGYPSQTKPERVSGRLLLSLVKLFADTRRLATCFPNVFFSLNLYVRNSWPARRWRYIHTFWLSSNNRTKEIFDMLPDHMIWELQLSVSLSTVHRCVIS